MLNLHTRKRFTLPSSTVSNLDCCVMLDSDKGNAPWCRFVARKAFFFDRFEFEVQKYSDPKSEKSKERWFLTWTRNNKLEGLEVSKERAFKILTLESIPEEFWDSVALADQWGYTFLDMID